MAMYNTTLPWKEMAESLGYPDRDSLIIGMYKTMGINAIAEKLGVYKQTIASRLTFLGIPRKPAGGPNNRKKNANPTNR